MVPRAPPEGSTEQPESPKPSRVPEMAAAWAALFSLICVVVLLVQKPCTHPSLLSPASTGPSRTLQTSQRKHAEINFNHISRYESGKTRLWGKQTQNASRVSTEEEATLVGPTIHRQDLLHQAAPFLSSAHASPSLHSSGGKVGIQGLMPLAALPGTRQLGFGLRCPLLGTPPARDMCCTSATDKPLPRVLTQAVAPPHLQHSFC